MGRPVATRGQGHQTRVKCHSGLIVVLCGTLSPNKCGTLSPLSKQKPPCVGHSRLSPSKSHCVWGHSRLSPSKSHCVWGHSRLSPSKSHCVWGHSRLSPSKSHCALDTLFSHQAKSHCDVGHSHQPKKKHALHLKKMKKVNLYYEQINL